ncbi:MAG: hypothetical protein JJT76_18470, partial [Clostridiaceae bacterium]|nr:hypothetical protein [Clostridiaceae bacterium]MCC5912406.1 hypothetical protein [Clostridiaceae bacterium]
WERSFIMELGIVEFSWTFIFSLLNIAVLVGVVYLIFKLVVKLPKWIKKREEKIDKIEKTLDEINKKLD